MFQIVVKTRHVKYRWASTVIAAVLHVADLYNPPRRDSGNQTESIRVYDPSTRVQRIRETQC